MIILSVVSLCADVASEMIYPVVPIYLKEIGFSVLLIGILEGIAEFTAGISKGYFGKLSDEKGKRLPFIKAGYLLSALSKPLLVVLKFPVWIVFARTLDRFGKGLRTASRDALLSQNATPQTKARVFGFHRAMDTVGAAIGPTIALAFLYFYPDEFTTLFYIAFIPGIIAVLLVSLIKEKPQPSSTLGKGNFFSFFRYWKIASPEFKKLVPALLLFTLFNSSDFFLLLRTAELTKDTGLNIGNVTFTGAQIPIAAYIFYNIVYAAASYPLGSLADRIGIKTVFLIGLILFALVYCGFAFDPSLEMIFLLFGIYGMFAAATEGISKAWITNLAHGSDTATAVGFYTSGQSICTLLASSIAGALWLSVGSSFIFAATAVVSLIVLFYVLIVMRSTSR